MGAASRNTGGTIMKREIRSLIYVLALGASMTALSWGGAAGCGSSSGGGGSSDSGTSGDATKGATSAALGASNSGADSGADSAGLVVQALRVQALKVKEAVVNIPETTEEFSFSCGSGAMNGSTTIGGTVETDDVTNELIGLDIDFDMTADFDACTPEDIASTTDVDESDYTLDGTATGAGSFSVSGEDVVFSMTVDGDFTMTGACTGSLTFDMTVSGDGSLDSLSCEGSGSVTGTVCDSAINCTISGDCDNPTISGTGC